METVSSNGSLSLLGLPVPHFPVPLVRVKDLESSVFTRLLIALSGHHFPLVMDIPGTPAMRGEGSSWHFIFVSLFGLPQCRPGQAISVIHGWFFQL
jgi:hypothetical protein